MRYFQVFQLLSGLLFGPVARVGASGLVVMFVLVFELFVQVEGVVSQVASELFEGLGGVMGYL